MLPIPCSHRPTYHDDAIKWKHFPRHWQFVRGIHWSPVNSPHRKQWRRALMFDGFSVVESRSERRGGIWLASPALTVQSHTRSRSVATGPLRSDTKLGGTIERVSMVQSLSRSGGTGIMTITPVTRRKSGSNVRVCTGFVLGSVAVLFCFFYLDESE